MAKITLDELSNSLKEHLDTLGLTEEQVNSLVQNKLGDLSNLETVHKDNIVDSVNEVKDIAAFAATALFGSDMSNDTLMTDNNSVIGAINELFQNVDSGKQLIANAIDDESITKDSTFEAMSDKIIELKDLAYPNPVKESKENLYNIMLNEGYAVNESMSTNVLIDLIIISCINPNDIDYVVSGAFHTILVKKDGTIWGAGRNSEGQLGLGDTTHRNVFTQINIDNVKQISCGGYHTFVLKNDGSIWATGQNTYGQLGLGDTTNRNVFTKSADGISNIKKIVCGYEHTCMLHNNGSIYSCGRNQSGQLGTGDWSNRTTFTSAGASASEISCGWEHTIALQNDGTIYVTGRNDSGELATGAAGSTQYSFVIPSISNIKEAHCGKYTTLILKKDNTLWVAGKNSCGQAGVSGTKNSPTQVASGVDKVFCSYESTFIVKTDGALWVSGRNDYGQLGLGDTTNKTSFNKIADSVDDIKQLITGYYTMFILKNDGSMLGAGRGDYGALGIGDNNQRNSFVTVYEPEDYDPTEGMTEDEARKFKLYNFLLNHNYNVTESMTMEELLDRLSVTSTRKYNLYDLMLENNYAVAEDMTMEELLDLL